MAATPRKQIKKVKFELTRSAIAGVGVICFCIFLWMFLLGVWVSESLLKSAAPSKTERHKSALFDKTN